MVVCAKVKYFYDAYHQNAMFGLGHDGSHQWHYPVIAAIYPHTCV